MKEDIFYCDDEWDNFIKRTKFNPADNVTINNSSLFPTNYLDQKHNWGDIDNECVIQWMAYQLYGDFDITERQYNQIVALYLDTTADDVNGMRNTPSRANEWNTRYKDKVGKYTSEDESRIQELVYQNSDNTRFELNCNCIDENGNINPQNTINFFNNNGTIVYSGINNRNSTIYFDNGYLVKKTDKKDENGKYIGHAMIPLKYNIQKQEIKCLSSSGTEWVDINDVMYFNCNLR